MSSVFGFVQLVKDVMTHSPVVLSGGDTLVDAARAMREREVGDVITVDENGALSGIVTDRDIVIRSVAEGRAPGEVRLDDISSRELVTVESSAPVGDASKLMREHGLRRIVVTEDGNPVGIVSLSDLTVESDAASALAEVSEAPPNE
ncbi:MAG TPA: CBS domain-containing protein [Acidimicrobiales bacterium]|jgi:CBS domain-containing protein